MLGVIHSFEKLIINSSSPRNKKDGFCKIHEKGIALISIVGPIVYDALRLINDLHSNPKICTNLKEKVISFINSNKFNIITSLFVGTLFLTFKDTNKAAIYAGYTTIALTHLYGCYQDYQERDLSNFSKHLFATITTCFTLKSMKEGTYDVRWHHMSYGLLAMLPNLAALNTFGSLMVVDSLAYMVNPKRDNYDFSNIFVNKLAPYVLQLTALTIYEIGRKIILN